jgi:hypothetical protein
MERDFRRGGGEKSGASRGWGQGSGSKWIFYGLLLVVLGGFEDRGICLALTLTTLYMWTVTYLAPIPITYADFLVPFSFSSYVISLVYLLCM